LLGSWWNVWLVVDLWLYGGEEHIVWHRSGCRFFLFDTATVKTCNDPTFCINFIAGFSRLLNPFLSSYFHFLLSILFKISHTCFLFLHNFTIVICTRLNHFGCIHPMRVWCLCT
jgi:hypothetical protein